LTYFYIFFPARTFPVSPTGFTSAQKELYSAVLNAQKALINMCTEQSGLSLQGLHYESIRLLKKELEGLGFDFSRHGQIDRLYPHYVGHGIGMDLHESTGEDRTAK
jgi:intermediate cleaving peptidase 55